LGCDAPQVGGGTHFTLLKMLTQLINRDGADPILTGSQIHIRQES